MEWTAQQLRLLYLVQLVSEAGQVFKHTFHSMDYTPTRGPNHLGL